MREVHEDWGLSMNERKPSTNSTVSGVIGLAEDAESVRRSPGRVRSLVALEYDGENAGDDAPIVSLKAEHLRADEVLKIAHRYGIPVVRQPSLAKALSSVEVDQQVPPSLFKPVALLLDYLERVLSPKRRAATPAPEERNRRGSSR